MAGLSPRRGSRLVPGGHNCLQLGPCLVELALRLLLGPQIATVTQNRVGFLVGFKPKHTTKSNDRKRKGLLATSQGPFPEPYLSRQQTGELVSTGLSQWGHGLELRQKSSCGDWVPRPAGTLVLRGVQIHEDCSSAHWIPGMGRCHLPAGSLVGPQAVADQVLAASGYTGTTEVCRPGFGGTDTCASARLLGGLHRAPWPGLEGLELRAGPVQSLWGHRWEYVLPCVPVQVGPLADSGWEGTGPVTGHLRTHSRGKVCIWSPRHG
ncbi:uncharacterized protein LOC116569877 [Mustela erminea]|uniref:uncharacterized protein LOC116569877 n=1 Tax=Mustela erminea TaxID=36723 RepID=UPI001386D342|nr:uncharacterized protein LOC116569877 [Mustela erminea]